ncbi:hypothetical protein B0H14DRAFT_2642700 [Mycena olivaceomarginata]|nr:hypothetical protein B0H14DRAFT_2642700 [Mycena olivaceomarginata]
MCPSATWFDGAKHWTSSIRNHPYYGSSWVLEVRVGFWRGLGICGICGPLWSLEVQNDSTLECVEGWARCGPLWMLEVQNDSTLECVEGWARCGPLWMLEVRVGFWRCWEGTRFQVRMGKMRPVVDARGAAVGVTPHSNVSKDGQDAARCGCLSSWGDSALECVEGRARCGPLWMLEPPTAFLLATTTMARRVDQKKKESAGEVQADDQSRKGIRPQFITGKTRTSFEKNDGFKWQKNATKKPAKKSPTPPTEEHGPSDSEPGPSDGEEVTKVMTVSTTGRKQDTSSNALAEAERVASETLASMWQTGGSVVRPEREALLPQSPRLPENRDLFADVEFGYEILPGDLETYDEGASGEDEYEVGARTISEVAGHQVEADCPISSPYRISATRHPPPPLSTRVPLRFATPSPSESGESSLSPEPQPRMRSVLDYLDDYM